MTSGHSSRSQFQPFESEDEGDCWSDISPPSSPTSEFCDEKEEETSATVSLDREDDILTTVPSQMKSPVKAPTTPTPTPTPQNGRRTPLVQWKRLVVVKQPIIYSTQEELDDLKVRHKETLSKLEMAQKELGQSKIEQNRVVLDIREELEAAKQQHVDMAKKLYKKEEALVRSRKEVETLKKVIQQTTSMASMQRNHAVVAVAEKDMILQNYREKLERLQQEVTKSKQREQDTTCAFQKELKILQESLASVQTPLKEENHDENEDKNTPNSSVGGGTTLTAKKLGAKEENAGQVTPPPGSNSNRTAFRQVDTLIHENLAAL